jgi:hypothetical protein
MHFQSVVAGLSFHAIVDSCAVGVDGRKPRFYDVVCDVQST